MPVLHDTHESCVDTIITEVEPHMVRDKLFESFVFVVVLTIIEFNECESLALSPLVSKVDVGPFTFVVTNNHFLILG